MNIDDIKKAEKAGKEFCEEVATKIPDLKKNRDVVSLAAGIAAAISEANKKKSEG